MNAPTQPPPLKEASATSRVRTVTRYSEPLKEGAAGDGAARAPPAELAVDSSLAMEPQPHLKSVAAGVPTVRAVVALARQLRERAEVWMREDPYARPYYPTTATARKLSSELSARHGEDGPRRALDELWRRTFDRERRYGRAKLESDQALVLLAARHADARTERRTARGQLSVGQRIDKAIAELSAISSVPAARADDDPVHGGRAEQEPISFGVGDELAEARRIAADAAFRIERELDEARGRNVERAAEAA